MCTSASSCSVDSLHVGPSRSIPPSCQHFSKALLGAECELVEMRLLVQHTGSCWSPHPAAAPFGFPIAPLISQRLSIIIKSSLHRAGMPESNCPFINHFLGMSVYWCLGGRTVGAYAIISRHSVSLERIFNASLFCSPRKISAIHTTEQRKFYLMGRQRRLRIVWDGPCQGMTTKLGAAR